MDHVLEASATRGNRGLCALLVLVLGCAAGCESRRIPELELLEGVLRAPDGVHPIALSADASHPDTSNPSLILRGEAPGVTVTVAAFLRTPQILVTPDPIDQEVSFDLGASYYEAADGTRSPIGTATDRLQRLGGGPGPMRLGLRLPRSLAAVTLERQKPPAAVLDAIDDVEGVRHRIHVEFDVAHQRHAIDAAFELGLRRGWYWRVPGTP